MTYLGPPPAVADGVAEVLLELAREIDLLGGTLCSNPDFAFAHLDELQAIDLIAQKLGSLAGILAAECPISALEQMHLDGLRERFAHLSEELSQQLHQELAVGIQTQIETETDLSKRS